MSNYATPVSIPPTVQDAYHADGLEGCRYRAHVGEGGTLGQRLLNQVATWDTPTELKLLDLDGLAHVNDPEARTYQQAEQLIQDRCDRLRYR